MYFCFHRHVKYTFYPYQRCRLPNCIQLYDKYTPSLPLAGYDGPICLIN